MPEETTTEETVETPEATTEETTEVETPEVTEESTEEKPEEKTLSHDDALSALKKVRGEAADWRTKFRDLETKLADAKTPEQVAEIVNGMTAERTAAEHALVVENVALKFKLPDDLAAALKGDTREELEAHAKVLAKYAPVEDGAPENLGGGLNPDDGDDGFDPVAMARKARRSRG